VTNDAVVAYVASMIDGTNADAGKVALPLGTVARVVANFFSSWTSTPSNPYNDVFMAGKTALSTASVAAETAIINPPAPKPTTPSYALTADAASVNEGKTAYFTLKTTNVDAGSAFSYAIKGVDAADVVGGALSGTATVGADGVAVIAVSMTADADTEGAETMSLTVAGQTASISVADTSVGTPKTYTLSINTDTVSGAATDDVINAPIVGGVATFSAADQIDGGSGTDTLYVEQAPALAATLNLGLVKSVETVKINNSGAGLLTVTLPTDKAAVNLENIGSTGAGGVTFSSPAAAAKLAMTAVSNGTTTMAYSSTALAGASDSLAVTANAMSAGTVAITGANTTTNAMESVAINTIADSTLTLDVNGAGTTGITVGGAGKTTLTVNNASGKLASVDASTATAAFSLAAITGVDNLSIKGGSAADSINGSAGNDVITAGAGNDTVVGAAFNDSIDLGEGDDTFTLNASELTKDDTIIGGAGTDVLLLNAGITHSTSSTDVQPGTRISGFETIRSDADVTVVATGLNAGNTITKVVANTGSLTMTGDTGIASIQFLNNNAATSRSVSIESAGAQTVSFGSAAGTTALTGSLITKATSLTVESANALASGSANTLTLTSASSAAPNATVTAVTLKGLMQSTTQVVRWLPRLTLRVCRPRQTQQIPMPLPQTSKRRAKP